MKMIRFLIPGLILLFHSGYGQKLITVQSGANASHYPSLDSAMAHAIAGDQIYIPGGVYAVTSFTINKSVMIFGAGHYPDSSLATGITLINGDVILASGSSGGLLTGCSISGNVSVGDHATGNDSVSNFSVSRCSFNNLRLSLSGIAPTNAHNFSISENIILGNIYGANAPNLSFSKNIIQGSVQNFNGTGSFTNNDFIGLGNCTDMLLFLNNVSACTFDNNVMLFTPPACTGASFFGGTCNSNVFTNNLFTYAMTFPQGTNIGFNSITNQPVASTFVNATGNIFDYAQDYHLKTTSPGYHGATDGYDVGIYGSIQPYKTAALPFNPHIRQKSVSTGTNAQGQLNIQVRVAAQDN